jgi:hypothetical protein
MGKRRCLPNAISKLQVNIVSWRAGHLIFEILKQPRKERRRGKEKKRKEERTKTFLILQLYLHNFVDLFGVFFYIYI